MSGHGRPRPDRMPHPGSTPRPAPPEPTRWKQNGSIDTICQPDRQAVVFDAPGRTACERAAVYEAVTASVRAAGKSAEVCYNRKNVL